MNTPKTVPQQRKGETDRHYFNRCRIPEAELADCKCRKCGEHYETDGESDNGLCYDCDN